jgi:hypothetical protein
VFQRAFSRLYIHLLHPDRRMVTPLSGRGMESIDTQWRREPTMGQVEFVWKTRWSLVKILYLLSRYVPAIDITMVMLRKCHVILSCRNNFNNRYRPVNLSSGFGKEVSSAIPSFSFVVIL